MGDANKDPSLRSRSAVPDDHFDRLVRNVYKVLLTRGVQGVGIYSPDRQTADALRHWATGHVDRTAPLA